MKLLYMGLRYWAGTIFIMTVLTAVWGLVHLDLLAVLFSLEVLSMGAIVSFPLILPCMWLLRITAPLPYSATAKTWWFAAMLSIVYIGSVFLLRRLFYRFFDGPEGNTLFCFTAAAVFIVTWLSRSDLENLYKQQTNQQ